MKLAIIFLVLPMMGFTKSPGFSFKDHVVEKKVIVKKNLPRKWLSHLEWRLP